MNQRLVWNNISEDWRKFRSHPRPDAFEFMKSRKGMVLDLGCGSGRNLTKINGTIVAADFSEKMLSFARKQILEDKLDAVPVLCDATELPFQDDTFDSVILANSLHCIKVNKHKQILEEVTRVSKKNADVFVSVWNRNQPRFVGSKNESFVPWKSGDKVYERYYYLYNSDELEATMNQHFKSVRVFGGHEKALGIFPKDLIAVGKVRK